jgi:hypothetical protein
VADELPLLTDLPLLVQQYMRRMMAEAFLHHARDLRATYHQLDTASIAVLMVLEFFHGHGWSATETKIALEAGLDRRTVRRRLELLIESGEALPRRRERSGPTIYVLNPAKANGARRVRRIKEATEDHLERIKGIEGAMKRDSESENTEKQSILSANGDSNGH